ncbi:hypothetical protein ACVWXO_000437 [Bradyrhizobium sp. LM2.7]
MWHLRPGFLGTTHAAIHVGPPGGGGGLSPTVWNSSDYSSTVDVISSDGLTLTASVGGSGGARATNPLTTGNAYFEITVGTNNSNAGFSGIAKASIAPDQIVNNPVNNNAGRGLLEWSHLRRRC